MNTYPNHSDIIDQIILPLLGGFAGDFDVEAIADEISEWHTVRTTTGDIDLTRSGLILKEEYAADDADLTTVLDKHNIA